MDGERDFFEMEVYLAGLQGRPFMQMTVLAAKNLDDVLLLNKYKRHVLPGIYSGQAYLRREYMNTGSWTGPSRAATPVSRKSAVSAEQPSSEHVETRAAKRKRENALPQAPMQVRIDEKQRMHGIASPARIFAPLQGVHVHTNRSLECYTIVRIGCFLFVTVVVKTDRGEKRINSARARVYKIADERLQEQPFIDKDFKELPFADDGNHVPSLDLPDDNYQIYHVTWKRRGPQNDTKSDVYISCGLDAESEQNILHSITQYMASSND